jgi:hypothetical protein
MGRVADQGLLDSTTFVGQARYKTNAHRALFERSAWQLQSVPNPHQIGQRFRLHFAHDQASADFYGDFADIEFAGDLLVEKPLND